MKVDWPNLRVAITGASSGIGEATAIALAERGASVALCARRKEKLDRVAAACKRAGARGVYARVADVREWDELEWFAAGTEEAIGGVDVVIANAGYGSFGNTLDLDPKDLRDLFQTNLVGAIWSVQAFGEQLQRRRGHAIVVGSVVSKIAMPYGSVYGASKWGLRGWTRGARPELEARGIHLTLFDPGYVKTEFFQHRLTAPGAKAYNPARGFTPEQAAKRMLRAIRHRPAEMEMTFLSRIGIPIYRLMPIQIPRIMARILRKRLARP